MVERLARLVLHVPARVVVQLSSKATPYADDEDLRRRFGRRRRAEVCDGQLRRSNAEGVTARAEERGVEEGVLACTFESEINGRRLFLIHAALRYVPGAHFFAVQIGRASCRERVS